MAYTVNYGQTYNQELAHPKPYASKRAAIHEGTQAVRELGGQSWAEVQDAEGRVIAGWKHGKRTL